MQSPRRLERAVVGALGLILAIVLCGQTLVDLVLSNSNSALRAELSQAIASNKKAVEVVTLQKDLQIDVIQVQQFLTDVSATRGLDGLGDGFDVAAEHATSFSANLKKARGLAEDLGDGAMIEALSEAERDFPPYYALGKRMAQTYVAEGPAGGNRLIPTSVGCDSYGIPKLALI